MTAGETEIALKLARLTIKVEPKLVPAPPGFRGRVKKLFGGKDMIIRQQIWFNGQLMPWQSFGEKGGFITVDGLLVDADWLVREIEKAQAAEA